VSGVHGSQPWQNERSPKKAPSQPRESRRLREKAASRDILQQPANGLLERRAHSDSQSTALNERQSRFHASARSGGWAARRATVDGAGCALGANLTILRSAPIAIVDGRGWCLVSRFLILNCSTDHVCPREVDRQEESLYGVAAETAHRLADAFANRVRTGSGAAARKKRQNRHAEEVR
jgi:hypothetical protein